MTPRPQKPWQCYVAVARYFDRQLVENCLLKDVDDAPTFDELVQNPYIEKLPGSPGSYEMERSFRESYFRAWWPAESTEVQLPRAPRVLRDLSCCLAEAFARVGDTREQLYHLIVGNPRRARTLFRKLYKAAEDRFDLTACYSLLMILQERLELLPRTLVDEDQEKRLRLKFRTQWAQEYYQTYDYLDRTLTSELMPELMAGQTHWILHLYATGGMGKTSFIRASISRYCVPRDIPCARLDFDDPALILEASDPWQLVLRIADQLKDQLPGPPFQSLLADYAASRTRKSGQGQVGEQLRAQSGAQEKVTRRTHILELFLQDLQDAHGSKPWVVVFDTLEELRLRKVDMRAGFDLLEKLHANCPGLRLILAGRYHLADPNEADPIARLAGFVERFGNQERSVELKPFVEEESREYLVKMRDMQGDPRLDAIVEKCDGNPFKLSLLAEIAESNPDLSSEEIAQYAGVDLIYLIDRVITRIPDPSVRWLIRYGVIPRQLTFDFVEKVMLPYLQKATQGDLTFDNPQADELPELVRKNDYFAPNQPGVSLDLQTTWQDLTRYASRAAWVSTVAGNTLTLSFQPDVVEPMRYLLREQDAKERRIFSTLNRDAVGYFETLARQEPLHRAHWMQEALYHQCQLNDEEGTRSYWLHQLSSDDPVIIRALAEEILRMPRPDERHTVENRPQPPTIPGDLRAEAAYQLARQQLTTKGLLSDLEWSAIRDWLTIMESEGRAESPGLYFAEVAHIRGRVLVQDGKCDDALALSLQALEAPSAGHRNQMELHLLAGDALRQLHGALYSVESINHYRKALAIAEDLDHDRAAYIAVQLGHALESNELYVEAAELYRNWWDDAVRHGDHNGIARYLQDRIRVHVAMGQESEAVMLGHSGMKALLTAGRQTVATSEAQPSAMEPFDPSWINILLAEIELANHRPERAWSCFFDPQLTASATVDSVPRGGSESWRVEELELISRIESARYAMDEAASAYDKLASQFYGPSTQLGLKALLDCAALFLHMAVNLQQADSFLAEAQGYERDLDTALGWPVRRQLLVIQRYAIQGKEDLARKSAQNLVKTANEIKSSESDDHLMHQALDWADSLKVEVATEWVVQSGANPAAVTNLTQVLESIQPATRRLKLLSGLQRCIPLSRLDILYGDALLELLPDPEAEGQDLALAALRRAEVERVLGHLDTARTHLNVAERLSRKPLRLALLRQVYLGLDRLGWVEAELRFVRLPLDESEERLAEAAPELVGLFLLEHAERCARVLGDLDGASRLLAQAAPLLGDHAQSPWNPRLTALLVAIRSVDVLSGGLRITPEFYDPWNQATPDRAPTVLAFDQQLGRVADPYTEDIEREEQLALALTPALNNFKSQGNEVGALQALGLILSIAERSQKVEQEKIAALAARIGRIFYELVELDEAAVAFQESVRRCPTGSPALPAYLNSLGVSLMGVYESGGSEADLETAHRSFKQAVELTSSDSPLLARYLNNLGASYRGLYVHSGQADQLQFAIESFARAAASSPPASPEHAGALNNLSASLRDRYNQSGAVEDLEKAIDSLRQVIQLNPTDSPLLPGYLNNLGISLRARYECTGHRSDLEEAVHLLRQVVRIAAPGALELAEYLNNLGVSLLDHYTRTGQLKDLEEAIASFEQAVSLTPSSSTFLPGYLTNLGSSLNNHYALTRNLQDLEKAIKHLQHAVDLTPSKSPTRATCLNNLGRSLRDRYNHKKAAKDLEEAIRVFDEAVALTDPASPDLPAYLNNLGQAYASRVVGDRAENIERALLLYHRCLERYTQELYPSYWALTHNNLGQAYANRVRGDQVENLEQAIRHYTQALQVRTRKSFPADWALTLTNLGSAYLERQVGDPRQNLKQALLCFEQALQVYTPHAYPEQSAICQSNLDRIKTELRKKTGTSRMSSEEVTREVHVSQSIGTVEGGKVSGIHIGSIGVESNQGTSEISSGYGKLQEANIARVLGVHVASAQLRQAVSHPGRLISIKPTSPTDWNVQLSTMKLEGDTPWLTNRVALSRDLQSLVNIGPDESCSPAFIRQFASDWASIGAQLGEVIFPTDLREEYLKKEEPHLLYWILDAHELGWLPWEMLRPSSSEPPLSLTKESPYILRRHARSIAASGLLPPKESTSSKVDILIVSPGQSFTTAAKQKGLLIEGPELPHLYAQHGARVEQLTHPTLSRLRSAVRSLRPRVLHIVAELRVRGSRQALDFGSERGSEEERQVSARELANLLSKSAHPSMVVLDPPTPPWIHERLRQLCLRNAFASKLAATVSFPLGILATGLADPQVQQPELANMVVKGLVERKALIEIARQIRTTGKHTSANWGHPASFPTIEQVLPFLGTAVFADYALHGAEPSTEKPE